jgi:hypothetical protein
MTSIPRWWLGVATLVLAVFAALPIFWVTYIPANDYPFHLARIAILSIGVKSGLLGTYYQFGSWLLPNMAMDAFALPLTTLMSPEMAVKVFLAVMQLAFLGGCVALHVAAFKRLSAWPLLCGLLLYNGIFIYGFFNYLFSAAFALWGAALWLWSRPGWARRVAACVIAVVLMWAHMGGFAVYAMLIGAFQLQAHLSDFSKEKWLLSLEKLVLDATPFIASLALFLLVSPGSKRAGDGLTYGGWWGAKPFGALFTLQSGVLWADLAVFLTLSALVMTLWLTRQLETDRRAIAAAGALWLAFVVLPPEMLGSSFADVRLVPIAALVTLLVFAPVAGQKHWTEVWVLVVALGLGAVKTAALVHDWRSYQPAIDRIVKVISQLPPGATLFAATEAPYTTMMLTEPGARETWHPPLKHVASYASAYGSVFVPMTFADPYKQPMVMQPPYLAVKALQGDNPFKVPKPADLVAVAKRIEDDMGKPGGSTLDDVYLLVIGADRYPSLPALTGFKVFFAGDGFAIYQAIARGQAGAVLSVAGEPHGG